VEIVDTQVGQVVLALTDGADLGTVSLPVNGEKRPATLSLPDQGIVRTEMLNPLLPHKKYTIEMAHVDRRITLTVNRSVVFQYDLPEMINRAEVSDPFRLGCQGGQVIFRKIKLYRDVYYRSNGSNGVAEPFPLREGEYFMLGDNSTESYDSRSWREPQVAEKGFLGKPFLLHQPMKPGRMSLWGFELGLQSIDWQRIRWLR
jgi:signal peptidase I